MMRSGREGYCWAAAKKVVEAPASNAAHSRVCFERMAFILGLLVMNRRGQQAV
jgi:hypothetical protein